jgi:small subunit ribosomal protein S17
MKERGQRKIRIGKVVSNKPNKTIIVQVERLVQHPKYKKFIKQRSKLYAHDEKNECQVGDVVKVLESKPLSRLKRWRLLGIVEKAK